MSILIVIIVLGVILFSILFFMKEFNLLKIYLVIISIIGLIGTVIGYGNLAYQTIKYRLINSQEYLVGSYENYQITQCEDPNYRGNGKFPTETSTGAAPKTPEEIQKCKDTATKNILAKRDFDYKDNVISSSIWGTIFLLLFIFHFPVFLRRYKDDRIS